MTIQLTREEVVVLIKVLRDHHLLLHSEAASVAFIRWINDVGVSQHSMERLLGTDLAFVPTLIAALVAFRISGKKPHAIR